MHMPRSTTNKSVQNDGETPRWRLSKATAAQDPCCWPTPTQTAHTNAGVPAKRAGSSWHGRPLY
jgi:hypothetical protein